MASYVTIEEIQTARQELESVIDGYVEPVAFAVGIATLGPSGAVLDVSYPVVNSGSHSFPGAALATVLSHSGSTASFRLTPEQLQAAIDLVAPAEAVAIPHPNLAAWRTLLEVAAVPAFGGKRQLVAAFISDFADGPTNAIDGYLRLHLLSHRSVQPLGLNMEGIFGVLSNVVWTNLGPFEVEGFEAVRLGLKAQGHQVLVHLIDKFPRMLDYVVPTGVRIADANRVRLGAHLAEGTTVMHEGFCNFNAGTLGASMVEGRISAGVLVGNGSDVGGGASIMGTLSGGGQESIRLGEDCLLGANSGLGISLGDRCIIEAGLYLTAGTLVQLPDESIVAARDISGADGLLFRRHSQTGAVQALARDKASWKGLNEDLHAN